MQNYKIIFPYIKRSYVKYSTSKHLNNYNLKGKTLYKTARLILLTYTYVAYRYIIFLNTSLIKYKNILCKVIDYKNK